MTSRLRSKAPVGHVRDMGCDNDIRQGPQLVAPGEGFGVGDVQARPGQFAALQCGDQLCGIGALAASDADKVSALFCRGKEFPVENPRRFPGQGQGIDDHVRLRDQFRQLVRQAHVIDEVRPLPAGTARGR